MRIAVSAESSVTCIRLTALSGLSSSSSRLNASACLVWANTLSFRSVRAVESARHSEALPTCAVMMSPPRPCASLSVSTCWLCRSMWMALGAWLQTSSESRMLSAKDMKCRNTVRADTGFRRSRAKYSRDAVRARGFVR